MSDRIDIDECIGKRELRGDCIFECTGTIKDGLRWKQVLTKDQLDDAISKAGETMTDIKVLSRDVLMKLIDGLPIEVVDADLVILDRGKYNRAHIKEWMKYKLAGAPCRLGWRVILALMDEHEEPLVKDQSRCAVCGWPLKERIEDGCVRGNCSRRPRPKNLYDAERAELERAVRRKLDEREEPSLESPKNVL